MIPLDFNNLTRRRADPERDDCWQVYCGDIHAGTIAKAVTVNARAEWRWSAGFYPGSHVGEIRGGSAPTYDEAKAQLKIAWLKFAHSRTPADFEEWRDQRDWTTWKYRMRDQGLPLPTQDTNGRSRCFCGAEITMASVRAHIRTAHREITHDDER